MNPAPGIGSSDSKPLNTMEFLQVLLISLVPTWGFSKASLSLTWDPLSGAGVPTPKGQSG